MTNKGKLIRTIYLYLASLISLIFVAAGAGNLLNTGLKAAFFPEAEKKSYYECTAQPPVYGCESLKDSAKNETQAKEIDALLKDYDNWKKENSGQPCISAARQNRIVDALTMLIIAIPIFLFHWNIIKKEKAEKEEN